MPVHSGTFCDRFAIGVGASGARREDDTLVLTEENQLKKDATTVEL